ncbi:protein kinase [Streptosporangium sp. NPDC051022]|uniref:serine/threonine-protein kinase n=1 Tax=Streptosporangium sp. NPDC051022 TaxID=3155752 RepID=UPI00341298E8
MAVTPLTPDDPPALGTFRLAGRLGEGGQGVVYLAHTPGGEPVAVKLLFGRDPETRARLARELSALESVAPFCTARVLAASVDGPRPYVVSEFVDGPSLQQRIHERGPLRDGELERLVVGTATALAAIHSAGIVHRDFKPANVLLGPDGPRVVDFGIARADGAATMTSGIVGTPSYMAPEQIGGAPASPASDVFAWAATMVCAASGRSPFGADTLPAVLHRILTHQPDLSVLPPRFAGLIGSCLDKDPSRRPSARSLMVSLVAPDAPPSSPPPSTGDLARIGTLIATPPGDGEGTGHDRGDARTDPVGTDHSGPGTRVPSRRSRGVAAGVALVAASVAIAGGVAAWFALGGGGTGVAPTTPTTPTTQATSVTPTGTGRPPSVAPDRSTAPPTGRGDGTDPSATPDGGTDPTADPGDDVDLPGDTPSGDDDAGIPGDTTDTAEPTPETSKMAAARRPGGGPGIPAAFAGTWAGHITPNLPIGLSEHDVRIGLTAGKSSGSWTEPTSGCSGTLELTGGGATALAFNLKVDDPAACVAGTLTLTRKGDRLDYHWADGLGLGTVYEGRLSRS